MSSPLFSVCVITYNQEKYIEQTLNSIIEQKHNYNYEIVIGDDCSTDDTRKIIADYALKYPDIIKPIYNEKNKGLIGNYYNTLNHCSGKYIMECAGDDWWLPGKVSFQIDYMEQNQDVGLCYGYTRIWNENKNKYEIKRFGSRKENPKELLEGNSIPAVTVCFSRKLFQQYKEEIKPMQKNWLMEDYPIWLYFSNETRIVFLPKDFSVYRVLQDSVSHSVDINKRITFAKNIYEVKNYYSQLYSIPIKTISEDDITFQVYVDLLSESYNKALSQKLRKIYKLLQNNSWKYRLYYYASYSYLLWKLFQFFISLCRIR